ncbi:phage major capsid family protein [Vibrio campbellii]|uniref:phage major capsid family protein n=1 Tax=Vibrio campbellii TaxID=680 RepID=UPI00168CDBFC|nr:phage major capsid protein [Vibrio campbellii]
MQNESNNLTKIKLKDFWVSDKVRSLDGMLNKTKVIDAPFIDLVKDNSAIAKFGAEFIVDDNFAANNFIPTFEASDTAAEWLENSDSAVSSETVWTVKGFNYQYRRLGVGFKLKFQDLSRTPNGERLLGAMSAASTARFGVALNDTALVGDGTKGAPKGLKTLLKDSAIKKTTGTKQLDRAQLGEALKAISDAGISTSQVAIITSTTDQEALLQVDDGTVKAWRYGQTTSPSGQTLFDIPVDVSDQLAEGEYLIGIWSNLKIIHSNEVTTASKPEKDGGQKSYYFLVADIAPLRLDAFAFVDNTATTPGGS